ncbi:hypothetical protein C8R45DRAFT_994930 [Mycena sanguinolenta]|nr:hypothetical protein C8R45DRAFT_994930 [Mycena sanguinolenta]
MLVDNGIPTTNIPQGEYMRTDIRGGTGGAGGYSPGIGGPGGIGEAPHLPSMRIEDLFRRFSDIRGGIGGTGGTGGLVPPTFVVGNGEANLDDVDGGALKRPNLIGGQGGTGGFGTNKGGMGGVGEATELSVTDVALFRRISGGVGGTGGASEFEGGGGGVGKASTVTSPLVDFLDDKTRRRLPYKKLDDLDFDSPALGQLLKNLGFESAGGLLELHEPDIPSQSKLKAGQRGELMDVLEDFIWLDED